MKKRVRALLFAAAMATTSVGAVVGAAPASATTAPSCVRASTHSHWNTNHVHVWNGCSSYQRVKVILAWYGDSGCIGLYPGESYTHSHQAGRFDRLDRC